MAEKHDREGTLEHGSDCPCPRCRGFQPGNEHRVGEGNELAAKHGAYAAGKFKPLAAEIEQQLRESIDPWDDGYAFACRAIAELRARQILVGDFLHEYGLTDVEGQPHRVLAELTKWELRTREWANDMLLTVRSKAAIDVERLRLEHELHTKDEVVGLMVAFVKLAELRLVRDTSGTLEERRARLFLTLEESTVGFAGDTPLELPLQEAGSS